MTDCGDFIDERNNITVSIIIPVYNAEEYIEKTINSIAEQTNVRKELIIIDDGSTDLSIKIILKMAQKYNFIRVYTQENMGATYARNLGIEKAKGKYLIFFDADDEMERSALFKMVSTIESSDADMIVGSYEIIDATNNHLKYEDNLPYKRRDMLKFYINPFPGNKLYKKSIIDKHQICFDHVRIGQDLNFYLKYLLFCRKQVYIDDVVSKYRVVNGSITRSYDDRILDIVKSLNCVCQFFVVNSAPYDMMEYLFLTCANHCQVQLYKISKIQSVELKEIIYDTLCSQIKKYLFSFTPKGLYTWRLYLAVWKRYMVFVMNYKRNKV